MLATNKCTLHKHISNPEFSQRCNCE